MPEYRVLKDVKDKVVDFETGRIVWHGDVDEVAALFQQLHEHRETISLLREELDAAGRKAVKANQELVKMYRERNRWLRRAVLARRRYTDEKARRERLLAYLHDATAMAEVLVQQYQQPESPWRNTQLRTAIRRVRNAGDFADKLSAALNGDPVGEGNSS